MNSMHLRSIGLGLILPALSSGFFGVTRAEGQVLPDSSVGTAVSCSSNLCQITGGTTVGSNLLHSFSQFDIRSGQVIDVVNSGITNILARVTGSTPSMIQGELRVPGTANFFLMNPNGITLAAGSNLILNGAFVATTADAIELANGDRFSSNPLAPLPSQLLAVDPSAFLFNRLTIQPINVQDTSLFAATGASFLLVGGDITLSNAQLMWWGSDISLGGLASPGRIGLSMQGNQLGLSFAPGSHRANLTLTNNSRLEVATRSSGSSINLYAHDFLMAGASTLYGGIGSSLTPLSTNQAGDITIDATGWVQITQASIVLNTVETGALGDAGDIVVRANRLSLTGGGQISALTTGFGSGGDVLIQVTDALELDGSLPPDRPTIIQSTATLTSVGNSGSTTISARTVSLTNGAQIVASMGGQGNAGGITIQAQDWLLLQGEGWNGPSGLFSTISGSGSGSSGNITVTAPSITLNQGAQIASSTGGLGNAGNVTVQATGSVSLDGVARNGDSTSIFSGVNTQGNGQGGSITIAAPQISLTNGAQLISATFGLGNAGNVRLQASDSIMIDGASLGGPSGIFASVSQTATGNGGLLQIDTPVLSLTNGGLLSAETAGQGNAGDIQVTTQRTTLAGQSPAYGYVSGFSTLSQGSGQGGTINLNTTEFTLLDGAVLNATTQSSGQGGTINVTASILQASGGGQFLTTTFGSGNAGSIQLIVDQSIRLQGATTGLFANTAANSSGNGGSITIDPQQFILEDGASISVNSAGQGQAGNIAITANHLLLNQSSITAATASGEGGNITLNVPELLLLRNGSTISATANGTGNGGNIQIKAGFVVAVPDENSDIIANAFQGRGGTINITTQGIFGIQSSSNLTPLSDLTASSTYGVAGVVTILKPGVDPSQGIASLPTDVVDATNLVAQGCRQSTAEGRFIVMGRGGLPLNPTDPATQEAPLEDVRLLQAPQPTSNRPSQPQPAQGWLINQQGEVQLLVKASPRQCSSQRRP